MTIYEIDSAILACVDPESGEIINFERLERLQMERTEKIDNVACWVIELQAAAKAISEQEATLKARRTAIENKVEHLKAYLSVALGGEKFASPRVSVGFRKSVAVEIAEGTQLPERFVTVKIDTKPNKTAIRDALKAGEEIPGCQLVTNSNISIK